MKLLSARNRFGTYLIPRRAAHREAARAVLSGKVYEEETIELIRANADGRDIVHAGTFFGDFLPALATSTQGTVWAFEPNPVNFEATRRTVEANGLSNVALRQAALSDRPGTGALQVVASDGRFLGGGSRLVTGLRNGAVAVALVPLDDAVAAEASVGIIHLDVEGHESSAIRGAWRTIARSLPILIVETDLEPELRTRLSRLGYRRMGRIGLNYVYAAARPRDMPAAHARLWKTAAALARRWRFMAVAAWRARRRRKSNPRVSPEHG